MKKYIVVFVVVLFAVSLVYGITLANLLPFKPERDCDEHVLMCRYFDPEFNIVCYNFGNRAGISCIDLDLGK